MKKVLGQYAFTEVYKGKTKDFTAEFVFILEQRQFFKWLRLSCTFNESNPEFEEWRQPGKPGLYPKEERALKRELDRYIKSRLLDREDFPSRIWREVEIEETN